MILSLYCKLPVAFLTWFICLMVCIPLLYSSTRIWKSSSILEGCRKAPLLYSITSSSTSFKIASEFVVFLVLSLFLLKKSSWMAYHLVVWFVINKQGCFHRWPENYTTQMWVDRKARIATRICSFATKYSWPFYQLILQKHWCIIRLLSLNSSRDGVFSFLVLQLLNIIFLMLNVYVEFSTSALCDFYISYIMLAKRLYFICISPFHGIPKDLHKQLKTGL